MNIRLVFEKHLSFYRVLVFLKQKKKLHVFGSIVVVVFVDVSVVVVVVELSVLADVEASVLVGIEDSVLVELDVAMLVVLDTAVNVVLAEKEGRSVEVEINGSLSLSVFHILIVLSKLPLAK